MNIIKQLLLLNLVIISACTYTGGNPNNKSYSNNDPFFVSKEPLTIKNILVPAGSTLTYKQQFLKKGKQEKIMEESKLTTIDFPKEETFIWGGVPIKSIDQFFSSTIIGYTVYPDFEEIKNMRKKTKLIQKLEACDTNLKVNIKNNNDWSYNKTNIENIEIKCDIY